MTAPCFTTKTGLELYFSKPTEKSLFEIESLLSSSFPVSYSPKFYHDLIEPSVSRRNAIEARSKLLNNELVGVICWFYEDLVDDGDDQSMNPRMRDMYVAALAVSAVYRGEGVGGLLLRAALSNEEEGVMDFTRFDPSVLLLSPSSSSVSPTLHERLISTRRASRLRRCYLHCHVTNEDAIGFYKAFGFKISQRIEGLYKRLTPPDGYVMEYWLLDEARDGNRHVEDDDVGSSSRR